LLQHRKAFSTLTSSIGVQACALAARAASETAAMALVAFPAAKDFTVT
jgi:hypothetical protein